jgi:hypothetical protein
MKRLEVRFNGFPIRDLWGPKTLSFSNPCTGDLTFVPDEDVRRSIRPGDI